MKTYLRKMVWAMLALACVTSCSKEDIMRQIEEEPLQDQVEVNAEMVLDGVEGVDTRKVFEGGYTTGEGLYNRGEQVILSAFANEGYELVRFYDKDLDADKMGKTSYTFPAKKNKTFKVEFRKKENYTVSVSATPLAGGTVSGGGSYGAGSSCTLNAVPKGAYEFEGWYENGAKVSAAANYTFTVSGNRILSAKFIKNAKTFNFIMNGSGYFEFWDDRGDRFTQFSETFTRDELGYDYAHTILPHADAGWTIPGDEWEVSDGTKILADQRGELNLTPDFYDKYADETTFYFNLVPTSSIECSITVRAKNLVSGTWHDEYSGHVSLDGGRTWNSEVTIKAKYGESVTINAKGDWGYHDYPNDTEPWAYNITGFYDAVTNIPYKACSGNNDSETYTFKVYSDRVIHVDFKYASRL